MSTAADALERFQKVRETHWKGLTAGEPEDVTGSKAEENASPEEGGGKSKSVLSQEDQLKRRQARDQILGAWRDYVAQLGPQEWNQFEKWAIYCAGDISVHDSVGGGLVVGSEFQSLIDRYGDDCWGVLTLLQDEAREIAAANFPSSRSDANRKYTPTLRGQPYYPNQYGGGGVYPPAGAELVGMGRRIGGTGTVKWEPHPGKDMQSLDGVLRMDADGIDWADKKIFKKKVHGWTSWTAITGFASRGHKIVFGYRLRDGINQIVEFEGTDQQDDIAMYSLARIAFPGPEYMNELRTAKLQAWRPIGFKWHEHWWVWTDYEGSWIIRYLFEKDTGLR